MHYLQPTIFHATKYLHYLTPKAGDVLGTPDTTTGAKSQQLTIAEGAGKLGLAI
jgi:hypothetical protein